MCLGYLLTKIPKLEGRKMPEDLQDMLSTKGKSRTAYNVLYLSFFFKQAFACEIESESYVMGNRSCLLGWQQSDQKAGARGRLVYHCKHICAFNFYSVFVMNIHTRGFKIQKTSSPWRLVFSRIGRLQKTFPQNTCPFSQN